MEILIQQEVLRSALQNIISIIDKSASKPILSNFLLRTVSGENGDHNEAEFSATDYEISIIEHFPAEVIQAGSICVNAKKVYDICREFQGNDIRIRSTEQHWVHITSGASEMRLPLVEVGLYPQTELEQLSESLALPAQDLKQCIDMTLFASQTNESRKNLMGVNLSSKEGNLTRWLATDGHRLAQVLKGVESASFESVSNVIIPRKALGEIRKAIELFGEEVTISFDDRVMQFVGSQVSFKTRLIEGKFPNCDPIIPKDNHLVAIVDRERLVSALRIVSSISYEKLKPVKLTLTEGKLRLESEKAEYGEVSDEMEADYSGEDFQVGFNSRYLLDALGVIQTERVKLECKNPMSPSVIRAADDEEYLAVIMPLRIEW